MTLQNSTTIKINVKLSRELKNMHDYCSIANNYHSCLFYTQGGAIEQWQFANICELLHLKSNSELDILDLGAGSCRLAEMLLASSKCKIVCVDSSPEMLKISGNSSLKTQTQRLIKICTSAQEFVQNCRPNSFDIIILKEVIHHFPRKQLDTLITNLRAILQPNGTVLICTRPQRDIGYPFFNSALEAWAAVQPDYNIYIDSLVKAEYRNIQCSELSLPVQIPLNEWIEFIRARIWSNFSSQYFSDFELEKGINELLRKYSSEQQILSFNEKQVYITAQTQ